VFSFLMSMPITAAAIVLKGPDVLRESGLSAPPIIGVCPLRSRWLRDRRSSSLRGAHSYGIFAL
jgi:hypothetical protein